jgi:hypothetical protein
VHSRLGICAQAALWCSVAAICALTFVWPFLVSDHADQPAFKLAAISTLLLFFFAMLALLVEKAAAKD